MSTSTSDRRDTAYSEHAFTNTSTPTDGNLEESPTTTVDNEKERVWQPINTDPYKVERSKSRGSGRPQSLRSLSRSRSHNGYSVDDRNNSVIEDPENGGVTKDPFEVGWEGGDADPLNPRSKSKAAKWTIVIICAMCSLCV